MFPMLITFNPRGPAWFVVLLAALGLALNALAYVAVAFLLAYGAAKGWSAGS